MEPKNEIGFQIHTLSHMIKRMIDQAAFQDQENPVTGIQGRVIGYLYNNRGRDVFQRDIQARFSIRRSTVTGILQLMEKNGFIVRQSVDTDARLKKLELTPKGVEIHEKIGRSIQQVEERLTAGITPEERKDFIRLCEKIRAGIQSA